MSEYVVKEWGFIGHIVRAKNEKEAIKKYKRKYTVVNPRQLSIRKLETVM
jgi:hypothetical protein